MSERSILGEASLTLESQHVGRDPGVLITRRAFFVKGFLASAAVCCLTSCSERAATVPKTPAVTSPPSPASTGSSSPQDHMRRIAPDAADWLSVERWQLEWRQRIGRTSSRWLLKNGAL
jgi:hypothetical protein